MRLDYSTQSSQLSRGVGSIKHVKPVWLYFSTNVHVGKDYSLEDSDFV